MKIGVLGLASSYWPNALSAAAAKVKGVKVTAASTLGRDDDTIKRHLGMTKEEFAERFGVKLYRDIEEMLNAEALDGVFVCAEHTRQREIAEIAANHKLNMYIAKPMATSLVDAKRIAEAVKKNGVVATTGSTERFDGAIREAHSRLKNGDIGDPISIRVLHQHGNISGFGPDNWYMRPEQGGPELSLIWYTGDVIRWFAGSEAVRVFAEYDNYLSEGSPFMDNGKVLMRFENRAIGSMDVYFSTRWEFPRWEVEVMGTKGALRTQQSVYEGMVFTADGVKAFYRTRSDDVLAEVSHWIRACKGEAENEVTMDDAVKVIEICLAARESATTSKPVKLPSRDR
ncbi:MAG: Gfo/Idh/MocA family oxidoreductase [Planctomycetes bacterium]|nr:Gfo/Idh/MocA family oxidoreductase [Planctomycetota bacterium]